MKCPHCGRIREPVVLSCPGCGSAAAPDIEPSVTYELDPYEYYAAMFTLPPYRILDMQKAAKDGPPGTSLRYCGAWIRVERNPSPHRRPPADWMMDFGLTTKAIENARKAMML